MPNATAIKVLLVDDQNSVRQMARITLEEIGFRQISEAANGVQAMHTAGLQPIDLIISDYNMPEMDGLALLRAVRSHPVVRKVQAAVIANWSSKRRKRASITTWSSRSRPRSCAKR
jgi:two-component system, chemotaxis family, chemotaxis protein CheY